MKTRTLGKAGLLVSELALGGLFVSSHGGEFEESRRAIRRALELGINYIDTAPTYANSEEVLGNALEGVTAPFVLSTKLGGRPQPFSPQDKACLMRSIEESLRLLKRDSVDILMVHEPDSAFSKGATRIPVCGTAGATSWSGGRFSIRALRAKPSKCRRKINLSESKCTKH